jgi:TolA-binding protein
MKRIISVLIAATMSWGATAVAMAGTDRQAVKEITVANTVKLRSANEKMMPAPEEQLRRLTKGLKLTVEQQNKIRPMLADEYARLKELRQDDNLSPNQIRAKVEALRKETVADMQTVLTQEQKETLDSVSAEIRVNKQKRIKENRKERIGTQAEPPTQLPKQ